MDRLSRRLLRSPQCAREPSEGVRHRKSAISIAARWVDESGTRRTRSLPRARAALALIRRGLCATRLSSAGGLFDPEFTVHAEAPVRGIYAIAERSKQKEH